MLDEQLANYLLLVRLDIARNLQAWNPAILQAGSVAAIGYWWSQLRPGSPNDLANLYRTPLEYAVAEWGYRPSLGQSMQGATPGQTSQPTPEEQQHTEAQGQLDTLASRFRKDWPLVVVLLGGAFLIVKSGVFR